MSLTPVAPFLYDDFCVCDCVGISLSVGLAAGEFGNFDNETVVVIAPVNDQFVPVVMTREESEPKHLRPRRPSEFQRRGL